MKSKTQHKTFAGFLKSTTAAILMLLVHSGVGCKKMAETPIPTDQLAENTVYSNEATAIAVLTSIYSGMNSAPVQSISRNLGEISVNLGLLSDEFSVTKPFSTGNSRFIQYYKNDLSQTNPSFLTGGEHWAPFYAYIFKCNAAIAGLSSSQANSLIPTVRRQLIGEAEFMRSFFYFYLVNEFGDVPLAVTTDPQIVANLPRSPKSDIYQQMIKDLLDAEEKLSADYLDVNLSKSLERVRPTKWAAKALLARVYLYTGNYALAEQKATDVINNTGLFELVPTLNSVFLKNSKEAIWQIQPTDQNLNTKEGQMFVIPPVGPSSNNNPVYLSNQLLSSFEVNDKRKVKGNWVDTTIYKSSSNPVKFDTLPYVAKYKVYVSQGVSSPDDMKEYFMVLRLAEQYLIRAEARAKLGNTGGAKEDINAIRNRAGLPGTTAGDQSSLFTAILHERQVELFGEWGHRWLDLKRTGNVDSVMSVLTPLKSNGTIQWRSYQQWLPVPSDVILVSSNLEQNVGY